MLWLCRAFKVSLAPFYRWHNPAGPSPRAVRHEDLASVSRNRSVWLAFPMPVKPVPPTFLHPDLLGNLLHRTIRGQNKPHSIFAESGIVFSSGRGHLKRSFHQAVSENRTTAVADSRTIDAGESPWGLRRRTCFRFIGPPQRHERTYDAIHVLAAPTRCCLNCQTLDNCRRFLSVMTRCTLGQLR